MTTKNQKIIDSKKEFILNCLNIFMDFKYLLLITIVFLFSMPIVQSAFQFDWNNGSFTLWDDPTTTYDFCRLMENVNNNSWVLGCRKTSSIYTVAQYNKLIEDNQLHESVPDISGGFPCSRGVSAMLNPANTTVRTWCFDVAGSTTSAYHDYNTNTRVTVRTTSGVGASSFVGDAWDTSGKDGCLYGFQTTPRYVKVCQGIGSNQTAIANVPSTYLSPNPSGIKIVYCNDRFHLAMLRSGIVTDLILSSSGTSYNGSYVLTEGITTTSVNQYDVACDGENLWFIWTNTSSGSDFRNVRVSVFKTQSIGSSDSLVNLFTNNFRIENYDSQSTAPNTYSFPSFIVNKDGFKYMSYQMISPNRNRILSEVNSCICSDWVNTTCNQDLMTQTRTCVPTGCSSFGSVRYQANTFCAIEYNKTLGIYQQGYEIIQNSTTCETSFVGVGQTVECSPNPISIPLNCINPNTTNEARLVFDYSPILGISGSYQLTSCNPSYNCFSQNYSCVFQLNTSSPKDFNSYIGGQIATGRGIGYVPPSCKNNILGIEGGVKAFRLVDTLTLTCAKACEQQTFCLNKDYIATKQIDCSVTGITFCDNGCSNNACNPVQIVGGQVFDPINSILSIFNFDNFSTSTKFVIGSILLLTENIIAFIVLNLLKIKKHNVLLAVLLIVTILGIMGNTIIGFYSPFILVGIILIGITGFLLTRR